MQKEVLLGAGQGRIVRIDGDVVHVKLEPGTGGEAFALVEYVLAPGNGPGQHTHDDFSETYYVLDGELTFRMGREQHVMGPGGLVHVPAGSVHGFRNEGEQPVRMLWVISPARYLSVMGWGR